MTSLDALAGMAGALVNRMLAAVPEPGTYAMLLAGLLCMGWVAARKRR